MRVLLVESDAFVDKSLIGALRRAGDEVDWVSSRHGAQEAIASNDHAVVLIEIMLPDRSGFDVLQAAREAGHDVPVLVITNECSVKDRVCALDLGADDFLIKPFEVAELQARCRAVTRRRHGAVQSQIETAALTLNLATQELTYKYKTELLTGREFALMWALMEEPGKIYSRSELKRRIYGSQQTVESNVIDWLIGSLRRRFDKSVIRNVRGAGWMIPKLRT